MEDVKNESEAQSEEDAWLNKGTGRCATKTSSGNMRGPIQALTGEGVAERDEKTEKEFRKLVMEEPAPSDTKFVEEMNKARKTQMDRGTIKITVRKVTRRLRASNVGAAPGASGGNPTSR